MAVAASVEQQADSFVRSRAQAADRRRMGGGGVRPDVRDAKSRHRGGSGRGRPRTDRGHRPGGQGGAPGIRGRVPVAAHERLGARPADLEDRRADRGERRRAGDARIAGQRQAVPHRQGGGRRAGGRPVPLHGGLADEDSGHHGPDLGAPRPRRVPRLHAARAGRRRRPDHPVELPAADGGVEARPGARLRLHRRAQAGRADAAVGAEARRATARGRAARRRGQHRHRLRRCRRRAGRARGRRQGGVHRLDRGRQADRQGGRGQPEEGLARARRQVAERRLRRRRPRLGDRRRGQRDLLQPRPVLQRRLAPVHPEGRLRRRRRRRRRGGQEDQGGARAPTPSPRWAR